MSINQSQPRMRLHPILLHSRFHRKPAAPLVFGLFGACVLAARLAGYTRSALHPCTPHLRRESPKRRDFFPIFPTHKNNDLISIPRRPIDLGSLTWCSQREERRLLGPHSTGPHRKRGFILSFECHGGRGGAGRPRSPRRHRPQQRTTSAHAL
jgi:hypothetical protein